MKDKIKNQMKTAPDRFSYAVQSALREASSSLSPAHKRISRGWVIVVSVILITVILPSAVFGASRLYGIFARTEDKHGLAIGLDEPESPSDYPEYVKMHIDIPEGFAEVPNTEGTKYCKLSSEEPYTDGFTVIPIRYTDADRKAVIADVESYEECFIGGHQAYDVTVTNIKGSWEQLYVYFEDVNVMLLIYHKDVSEEQLGDFVAGISFTEGTAEDHTVLNEPHDERHDREASYKYEVTYQELPRDTILTCHAYSQLHEDESLRYTAQITNIRITDSIEGLDQSCFNSGYSPDEIAEANGNLLPKEWRTFSEGDGFSSTYEELSCEQKDQKLILAEITYKNLSDEDISLFIPYCLNVLNKDHDNHFTGADVIDAENHIYSSGCCDTEITYLYPHGKGKSYYLTILPARETMTVTAGFRCNADMLDKAYLTFDDVSDVLDPSCEGSGDAAAYLFKVKSDDR